ncbi:MAG: hypothetical protein KDN19_14910 [Verrucomicrobiae bacterium]|nr:hypothetical protein [Verrucomicrobiae bacterium]
MEKLVSCLSLLTLIAVGALVEVNVAVAEDETAAPQFMLRVEIFDLPADEALRIQQEVAIQPDQLETRNAVLDMVKEGKARFVTSAPLVCRHGVRGKYEDIEEIPVIEDFTWNEEAKQLVPKFGIRDVGTIFEVDPNLGEDGETLDINFALEHHTGQPETKSLMVPMGDTEKSREVSVTHFHMKKVTTRVYLKRGAVALIGAFDVTGPRDKGDSGPTIENPKRLAFLCADVQEFDAESK